jgi:hypothetical protein
MTGIELIAAERKRQIEEEGFTAEREDRWRKSELAVAAVCYARPSLARFWPFDRSYWKPDSDDRIRELGKAGALIAAEIDRLQRRKENN